MGVQLKLVDLLAVSDVPTIVTVAVVPPISAGPFILDIPPSVPPSLVVRLSVRACFFTAWKTVAGAYPGQI